jgi:hypothetical protein
MRKIMLAVIGLSLLAGLLSLCGCGGGGGPDLSTITVVVKKDQGVEQNVTVTLDPGGRQDQTNQYGIAVFSELVHGIYTLSAAKTIGGKTLRGTAKVDLGGGQAVTVEIEIREPAGLHVTVRRLGLAEPGATITLSPTEDTAQTDSAGQAQFDDLAPGDYIVTATKTVGGELYRGRTAELAVVTGQVLEVEIDLSLVTLGTILATVRDEAGDLVSDADVTLTPGGLAYITGSAGTVEFGDLADGSYSIWAEKTVDTIYYVAEVKDVAVSGPATVAVELTLRRFSGAIAVTVTGAIGGAAKGPVEGAEVTLDPTGRVGTTDAEGKITFTGLAPEKYTVTAQKQVDSTVYQGSKRNVTVVDRPVGVAIVITEQ